MKANLSWHFLQYFWTCAVMCIPRLEMQGFQPWYLCFTEWLGINSNYDEIADWKLFKNWHFGMLQTIISPQKHCKMELLFCSYFFTCSAELIPLFLHFAFFQTFITVVFLTRIPLQSHGLTKTTWKKKVSSSLTLTCCFFVLFCFVNWFLSCSYS